MSKEALKELLINNQFEQLFEALKDVLRGKKNEKLLNEVSMIQARYNSLKSDELTGVIDQSNLRTEYARIRKSLLFVIDRLNETPVSATEINENREDANPQKSKRKISIAYPIIWVGITAFALIYGLLPAKNTTLEKLNLTTKGSWIELTLKSPWDMGNLFLDEIWIKNINVKGEYVESFSANGKINLYTFQQKSGTLIKIGTEANSLLMKSAEIEGKLLAYPETGITSLSPMSDEPPFEPIEKSQIIREESSFQFSSDTSEDHIESLLRLLHSKSLTSYSGLVIEDIRFYTRDENEDRVSLIEEGEIKLSGIHDDRLVSPGRADLIRLSCPEGLSIQLSQSEENLTFEAKNNAKVDFFIGNEPIRPLKLNYWLSSYLSYTLICLVLWVGVFILSLQIKQK